MTSYSVISEKVLEIIQLISSSNHESLLPVVITVGCFLLLFILQKLGILAPLPVTFSSFWISFSSTTVYNLHIQRRYPRNGRQIQANIRRLTISCPFGRQLISYIWNQMILHRKTNPNNVSLTSTKWFIIEVDQLNILNTGFLFQDFLEPSRNVDTKAIYLEKLLKRTFVDLSIPEQVSVLLRQYLARYIDIRVLQLTARLEFNEPHSQLVVQCDADICHIQCDTIHGLHVLESIGFLGLSVSMQLGGSEALQCSITTLTVSLDIHLPSGAMAIDVLMQHLCQYRLHLPHMLHLYRQYQQLEDKYAEVKMARDIDSVGKMSFRISAESILIRISDDKCEEPIDFILRSMLFTLSTQRLDENNQIMHKVSLPHKESQYNARIPKLFVGSKFEPSTPKFFGQDVVKTMTMICDSIEFSPDIPSVEIGLKSPILSTEVVSNVSTAATSANGIIAPVVPPLTILTRNSSQSINSSTKSRSSRFVISGLDVQREVRVIYVVPFQDREQLTVKASSVDLRNLSESLLRWLFIAQNTLDVLPASRFLHPKRSSAVFRFPSVQFSVLFPVSVGRGTTHGTSADLTARLHTPQKALVNICSSHVVIQKESLPGADSSTYQTSIQSVELKTYIDYDTLLPTDGHSPRSQMGSARLDTSRLHNRSYSPKWNRRLSANSLAIPNPNVDTYVHVWVFEDIKVDIIISPSGTLFDNININTLDIYAYNDTMDDTYSGKVGSQVLREEGPLALTSQLTGSWLGTQMHLNMDELSMVLSVGNLFMFLKSFQRISDLSHTILGHMRSVKSISAEYRGESSTTTNTASSQLARRRNAVTGMSSKGPQVTIQSVEEPLQCLKMNRLNVIFCLNEADSLSFEIERFSYKNYPSQSAYEILITRLLAASSHKPTENFLDISELTVSKAGVSTNQAHQQHTSRHTNKHHQHNSRNEHDDTATVVVPIPTLSISSTSFKLTISPLLNIGSTISCLLGQYNAYEAMTKLASPISADQDLNSQIDEENEHVKSTRHHSHTHNNHHHHHYNHHSTSGNVVHKKHAHSRHIQNNHPSHSDTTLVGITKLYCQHTSIQIDCMYADKLIPNFLSLELQHTNYEVSGKTDNIAQAEIRELDEGNATDSTVNNHTHSYCRIQGGAAHLHIKEAKLMTAMRFNPLVRIQDYDLRGLLYLAAVPHSSPAELRHSSVELAEPSPHVSEQLVAQLTQSAIPLKLYIDCNIDTGILDLETDTHHIDYLQALNYTVYTCTSHENDPQTPLSYWDNLRFWLHGKLAVSSRLFALKYHVVENSESSLNLQLRLYMNDLSTKFSAGRYSTSGRNFILLIDMSDEEDHENKMTEGDEDAHSDKDVDGPAEQIFFWMSRISHLDCTRLLYVPEVRLSVAHSFRSDMVKRSNHHSVPFSQSFTEESGDFDRFSHFRILPYSIIWHVELYVKDSITEPVCAFIRLDTVYDAVIALSTPATSNKRPASRRLDSGRESETATSSSRKQSSMKFSRETILANYPGADSTALQNYLAYTSHVRPESDILYIVHKLEVQTITNQCVFISWPSEYDLNGAVHTVAHINMQTRLVIPDVENVYAIPTTSPLVGVYRVHSQNHAETPVSSIKREILSSPRHNENNTIMPYDSQVKRRFRFEHLLIEVDLSSLYCRNWQMAHPSPYTKKLANVCNIYHPITYSDIEKQFTNTSRFAQSSKVVISVTKDGEVTKRLSTFDSYGVLCYDSLEGNEELHIDFISNNDVVAESVIPSSVPSTSRESASRRGRRTDGTEIGSKRQVAGSLTRYLTMETESVASSKYSASSRIQRVLDGSTDKVDPNSMDSLLGLLPDRKLGGKKTSKNALFPKEPSGSVLPSLTEETEAFHRRREAGARLGPVWSGKTHGVVPFQRSFALNHLELTPPPDCLPETEEDDADLIRRRRRSFGAMTELKADRRSQKLRQNQQLTSKIWGLRVIQARIIWTIDIRDVLFAFAMRYMTLFSYNETDGWIVKRDNSSDKTSTAFVTDQQPADTLMSPSSSIHDSPTSKHNVSDAIVISKPNMTHGMKATRFDFKNSYDENQGGKSPMSVDPALTSKTFKFKPAADNNNQYKSIESYFLAKNDFVSPLLASPHRRQQRSKSKRRKAAGSRYSNSTASHSGRSNSDAPSVVLNEEQPYFIVELVDPQINFLDAISHSSLIVVAGNSRVEGKKFMSALMAPGLHDDEEEARRKNAISLHMDDVSAYTASTASGTGISSAMSTQDDIVYWNHEDELMNLSYRATSSVDARAELKSSSASGLRRTRPRGETRFDKSYLSMPSHASSHGQSFYSNLSQGQESIHLQQPSQADPSKLHLAMRKFKIIAEYSFWNEVTTQEARHIHLISSEHHTEEMSCTFSLEIPDACLDLVTNQFYMLLSISRNLLLAVPPQYESMNETKKLDAEAGSKIREISRDADMLHRHPEFRTNSLDVKTRATREELRLLVENYLSGTLRSANEADVESERGTARHVEVMIGRGSWILRTPEEQELLEINFTGVYFNLAYHEDKSIDTMLEVQRFWAEDRNVEAVSSLTAPSFHGISDLQTEALLLASQKGLTEESKDKKFILMPYLDTNEPCFRCGSTFKTENNPSDACVFHECSDGTRGDFAEVGSRNGNKPKRWTCCGSLDESDPGCCARPHACKEMMFTFRAEASPSVRVGNIDIALYKTMEISVFPGASYDLKLLITRNLLDVVHNYFSISGVEANDVAMEDEKLPDGTEGSVKPIGPQSDADFLHTQSTLDVLSMKGRTAVDPIANMPVTKASSRGSRFLHLFRGKKHSEEDATVSAHSPAGNQPPGVPGMVTNSSMLGATTTTAAAVNLDAAVWDPQSTVHPHQQLSQFTVRARGMSRSSVRLRTGTVTFAENNNVDLSSSSGPTGAPTGSIMVSSNSGAARQEALFIRYLRVGEISVDVTTAGFPLNITNYKATVDPFFKRGTVMDWHRLILKIERHAKLSVARHTASNSISTIGNILFAKTPSRHLESKPSGIIATSSKAPELTSSNADQEQLKLQEDQDEKASQLLGGKETKPKRPLSGYFLGRRTLVASHSSSGGSLGSLREQSAAAKSKSSEEKNIHQFLGSS